MTKSRILLVDADAGARGGVCAGLEADGFDVAEAGTCAGALERLREARPDVVLLDYAFPDGRAVDVIRAMIDEAVDVPVVVLSGPATIASAFTTLREGAAHVLLTPLDTPLLASIIKRVLEHEQDIRRVRAARTAGAAPHLFSGRSTAMRVLARDAASAAAGDAPVLIEGGTGTGKHVLARWIHDTGERSREPFVEVSCAGVSRERLASQLLGPDRSGRSGVLESAHRGTMFIDEIGDMDPGIQPVLLELLQEGTVRRPGGGGRRRFDIRCIAATSRPLPALVDERKFLEALFDRISTTVLHLPPLRERKEDIPNLARQLLAELAREIRRAAPSLDEQAERALMEQAWPANVRELRNVLERAVLLTPASVLRRQDLHLPAIAAEAGGAGAVRTLPVTLKDVEWQHILRILAEEGQHIPRAARRLGMPRSTLYQRLKQQGFRKD